MRDYRTDKKTNKDYIKKAKAVTRKFKKNSESGEMVEENVLDVYFADGKVFKNIQLSDENVKKIIDQQEKQAEEGVAHLPVFKKRLTNAGVLIGTGLVGGPIVGVGSPELIESLVPTVEQQPLAIGIGIGVMTLFAIPGICKLVKNAPIIKELEKIKYRNENKEILKTYGDYPNSLVGLSQDTRNMLTKALETGEDPFAVININAYTENDMKSIVENIEREKQYTFKYRQTPPVPVKKAE